MKVDTAPTTAPALRGPQATLASTVPRVAAGAASPHAAARPGDTRDPPDRPVSDDLPDAEDLALWASLSAPPVEPEAQDDGAGVEGAAAAPGDPLLADAPVPALQQLTEELSAQLEAGVGAGLDSCSFEVDVPGLGRLQGRMTLRRDRADLELRALTPGLAHALRTTRQALQAGVDQAVDGDVNLFIA